MPIVQGIPQPLTDRPDIKPSMVLQKTKDVLAERGWRKGGNDDPAAGGSLCVGQAFYVGWPSLYGLVWGQQYEFDTPPAVNTAWKMLANAVVRKRSSRGVIAFNDDPATTLADVNAVLDDAIRDAQAQEGTPT
jgi:hypothetical protein